MKCETCVYFKMCGLHGRYPEMVSTVAQLTDTQGPAYQDGCAKAAKLYDSCVHYEPRPKTD